MEIESWNYMLFLKKITKDILQISDEYLSDNCSLDFSDYDMVYFNIRDNCAGFACEIIPQNLSKIRSPNRIRQYFRLNTRSKGLVVHFGEFSDYKVSILNTTRSHLKGDFGWNARGMKYVRMKIDGKPFEWRAKGTSGPIPLEVKEISKLAKTITRSIVEADDTELKDAFLQFINKI